MRKRKEKSIQIQNDFIKYVKSSDKSLIAKYTIEEIESAITQYNLYIGAGIYKAMEKRVEELKESGKLKDEAIKLGVSLDGIYSSNGILNVTELKRRIRWAREDTNTTQ